MFGCIGCGEIEYEFLHSTDEIITIQIVQKSEYTDHRINAEYIEICEISDKEAFLTDFYAVRCNRIFDDPHLIPANAIVVRIEYVNGDYELINYSGQIRVYEGEILPYGFFYLNYESFDQLLEKYLPEATEEQV